MTEHPSDALQLQVAPAEHQADALRLVFGHLSEEGRANLVASLLAGAATGGLPLAGLWEARRGDEQVGAVWAQVQAGKTGVLWPPGLKAGEPTTTAAELLRRANEYFVGQGVRLAQTLVEHPHVPNAAELPGAGFRHLADLLYLLSTDAYFPPVDPSQRLQFEVYNESQRERLAQVIEQTYRDTRDCPALNGVRRMEDVLTGYQNTGVFDPENWRIVRYLGRDAGCLLLADHPGADQMELVYMGLVPEARGQKLGGEIARYAQYLAGQAGRPRLVLAVDAENEPALQMYHAAGFMSWDRRSVLVRQFDES